MQTILQIVIFWVAFAPPATHRADVVVYGGTAGGVIAAVSAAREGLHVILVTPDRHLGGMVSGGLGWTDYGKKQVIGGYSLEFFERVGRKYGRDIEWHFEPHVAEAVFDELVKDAGVRVIHGRLREKRGVVKSGSSLTSIVTEDGATFSAKMFMDASYEGDLMAQAGVAYTFGREASAEYGESLAGVRDRTPLHQFRAAVSPRAPGGGLLAEITPRTADAVGAADRRVQAYNFRLCMTRTPANRVRWPKPARYAAGRYELLARYLPAFEAALGRPLAINDVAAALSAVAMVGFGVYWANHYASSTTKATDGGVHIADFAFGPAALTVSKGTTVSWTNDDSANHSVVATDTTFLSANLGQGATFEHTFDTAGTFSYVCGIHSQMNGTITVAG